jgi:hypothetical protein
MHGPINVKSLNNIIKWQMGFNSAFKGLKGHVEGSLKQKYQLRLMEVKEYATRITPKNY